MRWSFIGGAILRLFELFELLDVPVDSLAHRLALARLEAMDKVDHTQRAASHGDERDHAAALQERRRREMCSMRTPPPSRRCAARARQKEREGGRDGAVNGIGKKTPASFLNRSESIHVRIVG